MGLILGDHHVITATRILGNLRPKGLHRIRIGLTPVSGWLADHVAKDYEVVSGGCRVPQQAEPELQCGHRQPVDGLGFGYSGRGRDRSSMDGGGHIPETVTHQAEKQWAGSFDLGEADVEYVLGGLFFGDADGVDAPAQVDQFDTHPERRHQLVETLTDRAGENVAFTVEIAKRRRHEHRNNSHPEPPYLRSTITRDSRRGNTSGA